MADACAAGKPVVPEVAGAEFVAPVAVAQPVEPAVMAAQIDLLVDLEMVRIDASTPAERVAELAIAP